MAGWSVVGVAVALYDGSWACCLPLLFVIVMGGECALSVAPRL